MNKNTRNILIGLSVVAIIGLIVYFSMSASPSSSDATEISSLNRNQNIYYGCGKAYLTMDGAKSDCSETIKTSPWIPDRDPNKNFAAPVVTSLAPGDSVYTGCDLSSDPYDFIYLYSEQRDASCAAWGGGPRGVALKWSGK